VHEPPHSALQVARENVLIVHSLSKRSGMTGYRSGFMAGEPDLIAQLREARANFGVAPQTMVQQAAVAAWSDEAHVEERRRVFADKRALILAHLRKLGLAVGGEGAFYLWVHVPAGETSDSYAARLGSRRRPLDSARGRLQRRRCRTAARCKKAISVWPT